MMIIMSRSFLVWWILLLLSSSSFLVVLAANNTSVNHSNESSSSSSSLAKNRQQQSIADLLPVKKELKKENRKLQFKTEIEKSRAERLKDFHFALRDDCPFDLNEYDPKSINSTVKYCPSTADFLLCFPSTPANTTIYFKCPFKREIKLPHNLGEVNRTCNSSGFWESSNYSACIEIVNNYCVKKNGKLTNECRDNLTAIPAANGGHVKENAERHVYKILALLNFIGFCITVSLVTFAIFIFLSIRSLRCTRNMIHCNMLFTFMFKSAAHIGYYIFITNRQDRKSSDFTCVIFNFLLNYSLMCSFFWMAIEALYLVTVIVAAYSANKIKLWWYLLGGWVLPMIPVLPYTYLTSRANSKLSRATLVLFPLFGLTFAVCFYLPSDPTTLFYKVYFFVNVFLQTTQGVWVAFVYCFLNEEVRNAIHTKLRSWKISRLKISRFYSHHSSSRNYSCPTLYSTQITSTHSTIARNSHKPAETLITTTAGMMHEDPARLPILPALLEDKL